MAKKATKKELPWINGELDVLKLMEDYDPLIKSVYKKFAKFNNLYYNHMDFEDLESEVQFEFIRLCREYDPNRGVDFPGYVKFHLQQRVYHWVTKLQRNRQRETVAYNKDFNADDDESDSIDFDNICDKNSEDGFDDYCRIEALQSVDLSLLQNDLQKRIVYDILFLHKNIEDIAIDEGVSKRTVQMRLHSACAIFIENSVEEDAELGISSNRFILVRKPIRLCRTPIIIGRIPFVIRIPISKIRKPIMEVEND